MVSSAYIWRSAGDSSGTSGVDLIVSSGSSGGKAIPVNPSTTSSGNCCLIKSLLVRMSRKLQLGDTYGMIVLFGSSESGSDVEMTKSVPLSLCSSSALIQNRRKDA